MSNFIPDKLWTGKEVAPPTPLTLTDMEICKMWDDIYSIWSEGTSKATPELVTTFARAVLAAAQEKP
jgi:hypothetical protein